ncbi:M24 family metallopeptidase [Granulicella aggregans]|uniref:M24 family metallopeptidase n=1 Tax=Granulicella aggregans TaxID=474949 RepID=UPI0021DF66A9|nr:Xaa-Pro peptidase family protein [Granulicella aggregans]
MAKRFAGLRWVAVCLLVVMGRVGFGLESVPKAEYRERRVKLGAMLKGGAAVVFAAHEPAMEYQDYRQDEDFYYLTGSNEPAGALVVIGAGPATVTRLGTPVPAHAYREILFLPMRNPVLEKYTGEKLDAASAGAAEKLGVDAVMPLSQLPDVLGAFIQQDPRRVRTVWTQPNDEARAAMKFVANVLGADELQVSPQDVTALTTTLRMVKSAAEIELIRKATDASIASQLAGMRAIKPGVRERTIAGIEVAKMMEGGCERVSYPSIVGSGFNSTVLHYSTNERVMEKGDVVVIDAAGEYSMYASDLTRTMPVGGKFTARQREIYDIVLGAQNAARAAFVAGKSKMGGVAMRGADAPADLLDKVAYDYINTHGKDLHGEPLGKYFVHGLGHGVGIDVHDPADYNKAFDVGSVFTIEPGIYIPEEKIGVRIEDTFYVDASGKLIDFAEKLPHTADEVEAAMR